MEKRRIIDKRKKGFFIMDDEYLNGMAKLVGHRGTLVYFSLCRHADKNQECFPSIRLMSEQHNVSTDTIKRGIKALKDRGVIEVGKKRTSDGKWLNNSYTLLDKGYWDYSHSANSTVDSQSAKLTTSRVQNSPSQSANSTTKETHRKDTHNKDMQTVSAGQQINLLFEQFEKINPTINYGNTTQRKVLEKLIKKWGYEKTLRTIQYAVSIQGGRYAPTITNPYQLETKMGELLVYYKKEEDNPIIKI